MFERFEPLLELSVLLTKTPPSWILFIGMITVLLTTIRDAAGIIQAIMRIKAQTC